MADAIPNLWPAIDTNVISPVAVLRAQASLLREQTQGLLEAAVRTWQSKEGNTVYDFRVIAPPLDRFTYELFQAWHKPDMVYPVVIWFKPWIEEAKKENDGGPEFEPPFWGAGPLRPRRQLVSGLRNPASPKELMEVLGELLGSAHTRGVVSSLIAKINDASADPEPPPNPAPMPPDENSPSSI